MIKRLIQKAGPLILASALVASALSIYGLNKGKELSEKQTIERVVKIPTETDIEQVIDNKFEQYFRKVSFDGKEITLNMPFGETGERSVKDSYDQRFYYSGKGSPGELWEITENILNSSKFKGYISELEKRGEKVVVFDLKKQKYDTSKDKKLVSKVKSGKYPGNDTLVYVYKKEGLVSEEDIYNYLYCIGGVGTDCSGFVYNVEKEIALRKGINLDDILSKKLGVDPERLPIYVGTGLYTPEQGYTESVEDNIVNIRAGDIILFRGKEGKVKHSAVIQSVDKSKGIIRYMQSTDWAPQEDRGVHESLIMFDPENSNISLKDKSLVWKQKILPAFKGEQAIGWRNDGERYRAYNEYGGGIIVRFK